MEATIKRRLNVRRAPRAFSDWIIEDAENEETLYFCEHQQHLTNFKVTLHRGNKEGPIIAEAVRRSYHATVVITFGQTEIKFGPKAFASSEFVFEWKDRGMMWAGRISDLKLKADGEMVAHFYRRDGWSKDGTIEIYDMVEDMDVIVITFMMYWHRQLSDEANIGG